MKRGTAPAEHSRLSIFVRDRLAELQMKQSDFCRLTGFDQGLLSKIQNSVITSISLESSLRLAIGLGVPPQVIFALRDRMDLNELVLSAYIDDLFPDSVSLDGAQLPEPVVEISRIALRAHLMGRSLAPVYNMICHLAAVHRETIGFMGQEAEQEMVRK